MQKHICIMCKNMFAFFPNIFALFAKMYLHHLQKCISIICKNILAWQNCVCIKGWSPRDGPWERVPQYQNISTRPQIISTLPQTFIFNGLAEMFWLIPQMRGGGLGSSTIFKNLMSPTPRRKWYLTTGRRAH